MYIFGKVSNNPKKSSEVVLVFLLVSKTKDDKGRGKENCLLKHFGPNFVFYQKKFLIKI